MTDAGSGRERRADDILSPATLARLQAAGRGPGGRRLFTTSAGPREIGELARIGLRPLGAVQGSSIHHAGPPAGSLPVSAEVPDLTRSLYTARRFALARLVAAAQVLGAAGVAGVTWTVTARAFGPELVEVTVAGSAVSDESAPPAAGSPPWTTMLDADGLVGARDVGLAPVAAVFGTCVHHLASRPRPESEHPGAEIPGWTQAVADAREVALARLQADAQREGADGVIGLHASELDHAWAGEAHEYLVTASAVRGLR